MNSNDLNQSVKYNTHVTVLNVRLVAQGIGSSFWIAPHFTLLSLTPTVRFTYLALASSHYSAPYPTSSFHHSKTSLLIHGSFTLKVAVAPCFEVLEELQHMTQ